MIEAMNLFRFQDLFADVGGYLGLLLGYSLLSIYDNAKTAWTRKRPSLLGTSRKQVIRS